ncbi:uncharacterized protein N7458_012361 [Penicillium daleae]|uniref:MoaB/Mog domain-containing protein n=1 Tax=Penicillium daleae TaxID=63821 RepID=A0AAD6BV61_9EURO|nr:uncharacterized protein N7458_012361 [Penicillium daleae]KAJ5433205.1 hypothetical protein N7458_012361 [Penicillium daleae]
MTSVANSKPIHTAACLIIGDEVLGGKTIDTNSPFLAKFCFGLGIQLKRVEVIPDDEEDIIEAVRRMSARYDFVVTSGGIGPTLPRRHNLPIDRESVQPETATPRTGLRTHEAPLQTPPHATKLRLEHPSPGLTAKLRMVELPFDPALPAESQALFVADDMWVPIAVVNGNVHILPGVPRLFERLLLNLKPLLVPRLADPEGKGTFRFLFSTPLPESAVAPFLTELAAKVEPRGVKVGSYPRWGKKRNTVTLVGGDRAFLESLVAEVEAGVEGKLVVKEDELDPPSDTEHVYSQ